MHVLDRKLAKKLGDVMLEHSQKSVGQLAEGSAKDYADYRERVGYIRALDHVQEWIKELIEAETKGE